MFNSGKNKQHKKDKRKKMWAEAVSLAKKIRKKGEPENEKSEKEEKGMESMEIEKVEGEKIVDSSVNSQDKEDDLHMENVEERNETILTNKKAGGEEMVSVKVLEKFLKEKEKLEKQMVKERKEKDKIIQTLKEESDKLKKLLRNEVGEKDHLKKEATEKEKHINDIKARYRQLQQQKDKVHQERDYFCRELEASKASNDILEKKLATFETEKSSLAMNSGSYEADGPTPSHISNEISNLYSATMGFVRPFLKLLKNKGVDLKSLGDLQPNAVLKESSDFKNALAGFLIHQILLDFENESYESGGPSKLGSTGRGKSCFKEFHALEEEDAEELYKKSEPFQEFVHHKWEVVSRSFLKLSESFTEVIDVSQFPDALESSFVTVALAALRLHNLAFSFDPPAAIIRPMQGIPVDGRYVKLVTMYEEDWTDEQKQNAITEFMVLPGFRVRSTIQPCRVHPKKVE